MRLPITIPTSTPSETMLPTATYTATVTPTPTASPTPLPSVRLSVGDELIFLGDWEAARREFQIALETSNDPEIQAAAHLGLGRIYRYTGDYPASLEALRTVASRWPDSLFRTRAEFFLAQTYNDLYRYEDAAEAYQDFLDAQQTTLTSYIHEWRADALFASGSYSEALIAYQQALEHPRAGDQIPLQIKLARTYASVADYSTALIIYEDILSQSASEYTKAQMRLFMGQTYMALGQPQEAYEQYIFTVENYPRVYDSYSALIELVNAGIPISELDRGMVDYYAGQYGVALAAFDRFLASNPANSDDIATARYYRGLVLRNRGEYIPALDEWTGVIQNFPESEVWADAWEQKGYTQWAYTEDYESAIETFLGFVGSAPGHPRAAQFLNDAARVAERSGNLERAASLWEQLPGQFPQSPLAFRARFLAGITYYRIGEYAFARTSFQQAVSQSTPLQERAAALLWVGKASQAEGDQQAAELAWQQAASLDPTGYYSERALELLMNQQPFLPPKAYDLSLDLMVERAEAETWLRATFSIPPEVPLSDLGQLGENDRLRRGTELWLLGMYELARVEFEEIRNDVDDNPVDTYRLANYFTEIGLYRSGILAARRVLDLAGMDDATTLNAPKYFNRLRFGTYFSNLIISAAQDNGFHPLFLFSLVRQESLFESFIRSSAGARGLMQIIPSTGESIASRLGWPVDYSAEDLYRPLVSVKLGSDYLARQRDAFEGDLYTALAAYNGGPGNASVWRELAPSDPDLFLEVVRFEETRLYITRIFEIYRIYHKLYDRSP